MCRSKGDIIFFQSLKLCYDIEVFNLAIKKNYTLYKILENTVVSLL
jgi:hypothetical protein